MSSQNNLRPLNVKDRVELLSRWFKEWNHCEQTLALYSLLRRVSPTQARFLSYVLAQKLKNEVAGIEQVEAEANSSGYLKSLYAENEEEALEQLLAHLPLLTPGNSEGKEEYLTLLPKVLLGSCEESTYMDQCKQLLSLSLVHPAFNQEDRAKLSYWLTRLHEKPERRPNVQSPTLEKPPFPLPGQGSRDSSSLGSGGSGYEECVENGDHTDDDQEYMTVSQFLQEKGGVPHTFPQNAALSQDHLAPPIPPKSISLPRPSPSPSPAMSMLGSREDLTIPNFKPGMKDIPIWLKSLRLHKYQCIFESLSYDEMMEMTDDTLARMQVTQGARNKILQNIKKLSQRSQSLLELEKEVGKPGRQTLSSIIREMRQMLITPIRPARGDDLLEEDRSNASNTFSSQCSNDTTAPSESYHSDEGSSSSSSSSPVNSPKTPSSSDCSLSLPSDHSSDSMSRDEDLPGLITRVMTKVFNQMMLPGGADEECYRQFLMLLEDTVCHEAFNVEQRKLFFSWRQCCQQNFRVFSPRKKPSNSTSGSSSSSSSNGKKWNGGGGNPNSFPSSRAPKGIARSSTRPKGMVTPTPPSTPAASQCSSARSTPVPPNLRLTPRHMVQQYPPLSRANSTPYSLNQLEGHYDSINGNHGYQLQASRREPLDPYMDNMDDLSKRMTEQALSDDHDTLPEPLF